MRINLAGDYSLIKKHVEACIKTINDREDIAVSLKSAAPGFRLLRQIDLRVTADGPMFAKVYVCWDFRRNCWLALVEGPEENYWEKFNGGRVDPALN